MSLRGASADAYAALGERLEAVTGDASAAARVGEDLFALSAVLRGEPALRRVATDPSIAAQAKARLVHQLFDGRASAVAVDLLAAGSARRWTATRDLADSLESLGVVAVVRSASRDPGGAERLSDELFEVGRVVAGHPDLRDALSDPARSREDKRGLVRGLLEGKALPATIALVEQALAGTYRTVGVALAEYQRAAAEVHGRGVATVRVARPLAEPDRRRLVEALSRQYDRPVHLNVVVDPSVIGGARVEIGDDVIDGTVSSRLDQARRRLAG